MDINTALLALASDARLAHVPVYYVLSALEITTSIGFPTFITKPSIIPIHRLNVLCSIKDIYTINDTRIAIGNPCFVHASGRLHICQNTIVVAEANIAIPIEIISDDAIKNAIYRD